MGVIGELIWRTGMSDRVQFETTVQLWYGSNWNVLSISIPIEKLRQFPNGTLVRVTVKRVERRKKAWKP